MILKWHLTQEMFLRCVYTIDLSVSPSPRMQTSQWQSSISCTGSGTRTSLGFSAIEKHWKIRSSHRFYGVYASKMEKRCAWGTCNTDSRYPERIGNIIYFIMFPESKQNRAKCPSIQPQYKWRQKRSFSGCHKPYSDGTSFLNYVWVLILITWHLRFSCTNSDGINISVLDIWAFQKSRALYACIA